MSQAAKCPYCLGDVPAEARKCMHCGEWLSSEPERPSSIKSDLVSPAVTGRSAWSRFLLARNADQAFTEGVKIWAKLQIVGMVLAGVMMIVILSVWCSQQDSGFPTGIEPTGITCTTPIVGDQNGFRCS